MILLLSRQDDGSTREVAEWLCALDKEFMRINADDNKNQFVSCHLTQECFTFMINNKNYTFKPSEIRSIWHRRSGFSCPDAGYSNYELKRFFFDESNAVPSHLEGESKQLLSLIYYLLQNRKNTRDIGNPFFNAVNKLVVLKEAGNIGLLVPESYIVTTKAELINLIKKGGKYVTKAIGDGVYRFVDGFGYYSYTEKVTRKFVNTLPDTFFPSLVQEEIEKKFELRIFFLKKKFYSMAIFSNEFEATRTDSRKNASTAFLPRQVPFRLPKDIEAVLLQLMKRMKLNTGSIDMVVTPEEKYYFLEVNPIGQFGMVSKPCNYYLEKEIAKAL